MMKRFPFLWLFTLLVVTALACNMGSAVPNLTPTVDATAQADQAVATAYAALTASALAASPTAPPPSATLPPTPEPTATLPPTTVPASAVIEDWPLIRQGDQGPEVYALQYLLRFHGQNLSADGIFGGQTRTAVQNFQTQKGLGVDGIVGPQTWSALTQNLLVKEGGNGDRVRAVQHLLRVKFDYGLSVDGDFGPATDSAVRDFQQTYNLIVDGIVGPQTWQALISNNP